jgi:hypothetical protein
MSDWPRKQKVTAAVTSYPPMSGRCVHSAMRMYARMKPKIVFVKAPAAVAAR